MKPKRYNKRGRVVRKSNTAKKAALTYKPHFLRFVSCGTQEGWKFIKNIKLTRDRNIKLPVALNALVPKDIQQIEGATPFLTVMLNKKLGVALLICRAYETNDTVTKIGDKFEFVRDLPKPVEYEKQKKRAKRSLFLLSCCKKLKLRWIKSLMEHKQIFVSYKQKIVFYAIAISFFICFFRAPSCCSFSLPQLSPVFSAVRLPL